MKNWKQSGWMLRLVIVLAGLLLHSPLCFGQAAKKASGKGVQPKYKAIWEPVNYSDDVQFNDVYFATADVGWVAGQHSTILKTTDGGNTWKLQFGGDAQAQRPDVLELRFLDATQGWAVLAGGRLLRTTDGENWEEAGTVEHHFTDFAFTSEMTGVQAHGPRILHTRDGGLKWTLVHTCQAKAEIEGLTRSVNCDVAAFHFVSPTVGYAYAGATGGKNVAILLKTLDGGMTWSVVSTLPGETGFRGSLYFTDENTGVIRSWYTRKSFRTTDGGRTWKTIPVTTLGGRNTHAHPIRFADAQVGWALSEACVGMGCGNGQMHFTSDGGQTWTSRSFAFPAQARAISFPERNRGYAAGEHGMVYRYRIVPVGYTAKGTIAAPMMPAAKQ